MLRLKSYLGIMLSLAIASFMLASCQDQSIEQRAERYLRSQYDNSTQPTIKLQSKNKYQVSQSDLCQTNPPHQNGYQVVLIAGNTSYLLHTNADASEIEVCSANDLPEQDYLNYVGAGYEVAYPAGWQIRDLGLETDGTNRVYFSPATTIDLANGYILLEKLPQDAIDLDAEQARLPNFALPVDLALTEDIGSSDKSLDLSATYNLEETARGDLRAINLVVAPEFVETTKFKASPNSKSQNSLPLQVEVLLISKDNFVYKIQFFDHDSSSLSDEVIEQFGQGFQLID
jgi:hypothetical protein